SRFARAWQLSRLIFFAKTRSAWWVDGTRVGGESVPTSRLGANKSTMYCFLAYFGSSMSGSRLFVAVESRGDRLLLAEEAVGPQLSLVVLPRASNATHHTEHKKEA
ncbi:unnamed protein product, partial [Hapterophycus canaliculatus]